MKFNATHISLLSGALGTPGDEEVVGAVAPALGCPTEVPPLAPSGHTGMHTGRTGGEGGV